MNVVHESKIIAGNRRIPVMVVPLLAALLFMFFAGGCASDDPDTSAPRRAVIDRTADWQGALLYIADESGPLAQWGSIRVYDNVSGFVEKTIEQSAAATPVDTFVTADGSSMYVAGKNGRIDKFRWDGNNWNRGAVTIDVPSKEIGALKPSPDGNIYAVASETGATGGLYRIDTAVDRADLQPLAATPLTSLRGVSWSPDGLSVYLAGATGEGQYRLYADSWPTMQVKGFIDLPDTALVNQAETSADGRFVFIAAKGKVFKADIGSMAVAGSFAPSGNPETVYADCALSADGRFLFTDGKTPGEDSTLYVIDLVSGATVKSVRHISDTAGGIQRVE